MAKVYIKPIKEFDYVRDSGPEHFKPGKHPDGSPHVFEFDQHKAENIQRLGLGVVVKVRQVVIDEPDTDPNAPTVLDGPTVVRSDVQMAMSPQSQPSGQQPAAEPAASDGTAPARVKAKAK